MYSINVSYNNKENYWITQVLDENNIQVQASYSEDIEDRDEDIKIYTGVFNIDDINISQQFIKSEIKEL